MDRSGQEVDKWKSKFFGQSPNQEQNYQGKLQTQ